MSLPEIPHDPWFDQPHPHDSMPIATDKTPVERLHDDIREDNYASRHESTPEFEKTAEEVVTMHEKMYRMARAKYNPFSIGGSESILDKK
tara:strand:- start:429 stop:698 length:270 start_codon:yes stop_codon:yes gene_type:complete